MSCDYDLANCIGSTTYQIGHRSNATERGHVSCLATLFFKGETELIELQLEKKLTLGMSLVSDIGVESLNFLFETIPDLNTATGSTEYPGCKVCIIELACEKQFTGPNTTIRSDLQTYAKIPAIKIHVKLPDPLKHLCGRVPSVYEMSYFPTKSAAGVQMLTEVRQKLLTSPKLESTEKLIEVARRINSNMRTLPPTLQDELSSGSTWKTSIGMRIISFLGSMILHFMFMFFYQMQDMPEICPWPYVVLNAGENASTGIEQEIDTKNIRRRVSTGDTLVPARFASPAPLYGIENYYTF